MNVLLDTCAFLWWVADDPALGATAAETIRNPRNTCSLSAASLWEMQVKHAAGKLEIDSGERSAFDFLCVLCAENHIDLLPLNPQDVRHISTLPQLHRDPFDRILICQAIELGLTILTPDPFIRRYPVKTLW